MPGEVGIDMPVTIYSDGQVFTGDDCDHKTFEVMNSDFGFMTGFLLQLNISDKVNLSKLNIPYNV
jgi:hypothetical protein